MPDCESLQEKRPLAHGDSKTSTASGKYGIASSASVVHKPLVYVCVLICSVELCERLAFYTFNGTQVFFLERVGDSMAAASAINAAMVTLCMALTVVGGWMADSVLGRFWTIMMFGFQYVVGCSLAAWAAQPENESRSMYLVGVMIFIPLGTAGIKANISNFGAEQFDTSDREGQEAQEKFFSWFYLSINLGAGVAYGFLTTFGSTGGLGVPRAYGYLTVYSIAALAMLVAVGLFFAGHTLYIVHPPASRSSLGASWRYLWGAAQHGAPKAIGTIVAILLAVIGLTLSVLSSMLYWMNSVAVLTWCAAITSGLAIALIICCNIRPNWVETVVLRDDHFSADDVSNFFRILPLLFLGQLAFGALYNSCAIWYQIQACQMDLRVWISSDLHSQQVSGSFFNVANCVAIVVGTPFVLGVANPALEKVTGTALTYSVKFIIGMVFGVLSVLTAAWIEITRRGTPHLPVESNCAPHGLHMTAMSAHWMLVPFSLMGIAEVYVMPTLMYFAYNQSPPSMRTLSTVISFFMMGVSSSLFSIMVIMLAKFVPDDLNKGHLEYGYFANIAIGALFASLFVVAAQRFQEKTFD